MLGWGVKEGLKGRRVTKGRKVVKGGMHSVGRKGYRKGGRKGGGGGGRNTVRGRTRNSWIDKHIPPK